MSGDFPDGQWAEAFLRGEWSLAPSPPDFDRRVGNLAERLDWTVPLHIAELRAQGGPDEWHLRRAKEIGQAIAEKGDVLMFGQGKEAAERERLTRMLSEGLAVLAFSPGGVTFVGRHWEAAEEGQTP